MADLRGTRLVGTALRFYPARWRRRHGGEASELAALLIRDGIAPASIALSYLAGAAREWLVPRPGRRLSRMACALLVAASSLSVSAGLLASPMPARAASPSNVRGHAHCRSHSPEPVIPATGRPQVILWEAGHGRSC